MISGLIGGGAAQGLEELLARQLLEAQQAERERATRAQEGLAGRRLDQDAAQHADSVRLQEAGLERQDRARRDRANEAGLRDMYQQRALMDKEAEAQQAADAERELLDQFLQLPGLSDAQRAVVTAAIRAGRDVNLGDVETDADRKARDDRDVSKALRIARGQQQAERDFAPPPRAEKPDAGTAVTDDYSAERETRVLQSIDELMGQVGRSTVGAGSLLAMIPESDARSFKSQLDTLKSNIAFNELTQMRAASKTGGALGNVSNVELALLESALGALDRAQSPDQFKTQLAKVRGSVERWQKARQQASGDGRPPAPVPTSGGGAANFRYERVNGKLVRVGG